MEWDFSFGRRKNILDFEDFLVSNNLLPLGSLIYLLFCTSRYGWGWKKFTEEANSGQGIRFPKWARVYVSYILPLIVLFIFVQGYITMFKAHRRMKNGKEVFVIKVSGKVELVKTGSAFPDF